MGAALSNEYVEDPVPLSEVEMLRAEKQAYQQKIRELDQTIATLLNETKSLSLQHQNEIDNLTNTFTIKFEKALAAAAAKREDEIRCQLEQQKEDQLRRKQEQLEAKHEADLLEQRLKSVKVYDDANFVHLGGEDKLDPSAFPFALLRAGYLADRKHVLRIQLKEAFRKHEDLQRFRKSVAIMQASNGKDSRLLQLVGACDLFGANPIAYVEYFVGCDLRTYLMDHTKKLTMQQILAIALEVAKALVEVHKVGVMHRDISWTRIYIARNGRVKVLLGLKAKTSTTSNDTNGITEARWGAPETLQPGKIKYTDAIDVFSFGLVLISLITRDLPFTHVVRSGKTIDDKRVETLLQKPETAAELLSNYFEGFAVPDAYATLVEKCITWDPAERPTAPEVVRCLLEQLNEQDVPRHLRAIGTLDLPDVGLELAIIKGTNFNIDTNLFAFQGYSRMRFDKWAETPRVPETNNVLRWGWHTKLENVRPLGATVQFAVRKASFMWDKSLGQVTLRLDDLLNPKMLSSDTERASLTAPRTVVLDVYNDGNVMGQLHVLAAFTGRITEYLNVVREDRARVLLARQGNQDYKNEGLQQEHDVAAAALAAVASAA
ncbi:TKL protein kinase [Saprolegnia parasitica CBS 223.65]|uniref:TKL protein kinase n=1 Tax=Saprolegnia parasitica (strain CBS 223.65) TaxID=695850 RepID=A0A067CNT6_SAPPC|nr:TKL protein kinase [Saprolegnia parasitica CBS 223.65]KDO30910.1 TKL protein kinase [Saprolegnia parasitica CBS 223.65]|eukprot:XP_012198602.1 TKL protein kinase [Saprolegnia parasitica CBS 223.65]